MLVWSWFPTVQYYKIQIDWYFIVGISPRSHCFVDSVILLTSALSATTALVNTLGPRQNGLHFADDTFKRIFLNENVRISIKISLKFVPKVPIDNIPVLVQIMAWHRQGDKPISEPIMARLLMYKCVSRPQWVKPLLQLWHESVITSRCFMRT